MDAATIASRRLGQPVSVSGIILDGEEDGAAIVAALDDVQLLVGEEIAAEPGHRRHGEQRLAVRGKKSYSEPDYSPSYGLLSLLHGRRPLRRQLWKRREVAQNRWNELRDRGMDVHRALEHGVGRLGVHDVQHAVDRLVAAGAQKGGAQDRLGFGI